jgi:hypothetical protein
MKNITTKQTVLKPHAKQLSITDFPFIVKDRYSNEIYWENSDGYWFRREYDANGNEIYWENSYGLWIKREWDAHGKEIYIEDSSGGIIMDYRPKTSDLML